MKYRKRRGNEDSYIEEYNAQIDKHPNPQLAALERQAAPVEPQGDALPTAIGDKFVIANGEMRFLAQAINRLDDVTDKPAAPQPDRLAAPVTFRQWWDKYVETHEEDWSKDKMDLAERVWNAAKETQ